MHKQKQNNDDFDSPWKDILEILLQDMMNFLFPDISSIIDWSKGYEPLDKEFQKITFDANTGRKYADKLIKVFKLDGSETLILIHIEVQAQKEQNFPERMFIYNYRIFDRFRKTVISLAILADNTKHWRPDRFGYGEKNAKMELRFPIAKIIDFADKWDYLEQNDNIFSLCIMAHLKAMETKDNYEQRKKWKFYLLRLMLKKGYGRKKIVQLLRFTDWVLTLPDELNQQLWHDFNQLKEVKKMPYISGFEKMLMEKGLQKGIQKGIQKAKQEDILEILAIKNDFIPDEIQQKIKQITDTTSLQTLLRVAILKQSLSEFKQELNKLMQ
jgi:hypothetical protein